jgi:hypothetical protein
MVTRYLERQLLVTTTGDDDLRNYRLRIAREGERETSYVDIPGDSILSLGSALGRWLVQCEDIRQRKSSGRVPATHRKNAIEALQALNEILVEHGYAGGLPETLGRLYAALMTVDEAKQKHAMFDPAETPSATLIFDPIIRGQIKASAAPWFNS